MVLLDSKISLRFCLIALCIRDLVSFKIESLKVKQKINRISRGRNEEKITQVLYMEILFT